MKHFRAFALIAAGILSFLSPGASAWEEEKVLRVFNWSDYIAPYTILNFEQETGIKVFYDIYDSNEVLDEKVMKGNTGYDLVVPGSDFLAKQIKAGVYRKLNKDNIPNWKNIDPVQMRLLEAVDPGMNTPSPTRSEPRASATTLRCSRSSSGKARSPTPGTTSLSPRT